MDLVALPMLWNAHLTETAMRHESAYFGARLTALVHEGGVYEHEHAFYRHVFQHGNDFERLVGGHYKFHYPPLLVHVTLPAGQSPAGVSSAENVTCIVCGKSLAGKRRHSQTCSSKCRKALSRRRNHVD